MQYFFPCKRKFCCKTCQQDTSILLGSLIYELASFSFNLCLVPSSIVLFNYYIIFNSITLLNLYTSTRFLRAQWIFLFCVYMQLFPLPQWDKHIKFTKAVKWNSISAETWLSLSYQILTCWIVESLLEISCSNSCNRARNCMHFDFTLF